MCCGTLKNHQIWANLVQLAFNPFLSDSGYYPFFHFWYTIHDTAAVEKCYCFSGHIHSSEIEAFWPIKCPRSLRLLKLSHFLCWIWICINFWNNCYGLQMRPDFQLIGVSRRDRRLKLFDSCNSRTFIGGSWGCPRLPGHPNLKYFLFQSSQFGDFDQNHTNKLFFFQKINSGILQDHRQVLLAIFGDLWASPDTPRVPDKSARIATVKELQPANAAPNTNETKNWPHLEAGAVIQKSIRYSNSIWKLTPEKCSGLSRAFWSSKTFHFWTVSYYLLNISTKKYQTKLFL